MLYFHKAKEEIAGLVIKKLPPQPVHWDRKTPLVVIQSLQDWKNNWPIKSLLKHYSLIFELWSQMALYLCGIPLFASTTWTKLFPPTPNSHIEVLPYVLQNVTIFGDRVFKKVIRVKWGHVRGPESRNDRHLHTKSKSGLRQHTDWEAFLWRNSKKVAICKPDYGYHEVCTKYFQL